MRISDWSSDVCSSDLRNPEIQPAAVGRTAISEWLSRVPPVPVDRRWHQECGRLRSAEKLALRLHGRWENGVRGLASPLRRQRTSARSRTKSKQRRRLCFRPIGRNHRSEEHTSELQSLMRISYAVFCLKKTKTNKNNTEKQ